MQPTPRIHKYEGDHTDAFADLSHLEAEYPGSIIAAQAFPGRVFGMTPAPGFERVPPAEKRMDPNKFTTF